MHASEIDIHGHRTERNADRKDIAKEFGMYIRDLRPVFSLKQLSTISPRGDGIVMNLRDIKMVIGTKKTLLLHLDSRYLKDTFIPSVVERVQNTEASISFELRVLEAGLFYGFLIFSERFQKIESDIHKILFRMKGAPTDEQLESLLGHKKSLNKMQISVKEVEEMLEETIRDDDDIPGICLSDPTEQEEAESILEHSWEQFEDLSHRIDELDENVDDTQEVITLQMANSRNMVIRLDLYATMVTLIVSFMGLVTGVFGMNLRSHIESDSISFFVVSGGIFIGIIVGVLGIHWYLKKKKL